MKLVAALVAVFGCSEPKKGKANRPDDPAPTTPKPADTKPLYRSATVTALRIPDIADKGLQSISPTGAARLYRKAEPEPTGEGLVEVTWCLHRDNAEPVCLLTKTKHLRCLGGSRPVGWRPDEKAVVLCGEEERRGADGHAFIDGWDSVLDFETGRVVQLDPRKGPMVTPIWSRDGKRVFAFSPNGKVHRPWRDTGRAPVSLEPFASPPSTQAAREDDFGPVWATAGHLVSGAMLFAGPTMTRHPVAVTEAGQDIVDVTPDRRFAIAEDDNVSKGHDGMLWHILALETKKATPLGNPEGFRHGTHAELSDAGDRVLAIWTGDDERMHLGITGDRGATWNVVHSWADRDPDAPHRYISDGELQWNGGPTAWIIAESNAVLRVDLTR